MSQRERNRDPETTITPPASGGSGGGGDAAANARRLLAAADDVIERALSGDSERFLSDHRQQGGQ